MKCILGLMLVWMAGATGAFAQVEDAVAAVDPEFVKIMGTEAVGMQETIHGYMQGAMRRDRLELFDRKKGKNVILQLDQIVMDDPSRVKFLQPNQVAICGKCTEIASVTDESGEVRQKGVGDQYEVWFLLQRGGTFSSRVLETYIKSVNGNPMYEWIQDSNGKWSATLVPDPQ